MNGLSAMLLCDFYKVSHRPQYPKNTEVVYSTWTPRDSRIKGIESVVCFGIQSFVKNYLIDFFNEHFFDRDKEIVIEEYRRVIKGTLGIQDPEANHIEDLHDLGYLPLEIKAVAEGLTVPIRVPMMTIQNTNPKFFWLTNYIETIMSCELWQPMTSATIANEYRKMLDHYANMTGGDLNFVPFQGHDFSMRGMGSLQSAMASGAGHLLSFNGTDTIPAITYLENFYNCNLETELIGTSIPATEHSVMCANGQDEMATYKRMITEVYPEGFVSIVSDTWDLWAVLEKVVKGLKNEIMQRNGKVVIRPDSGDPVKILCGDPFATDERVRKGVVEYLWDIFGGTTTSKGFRQLDSHIGVIYGDAITLERCREICERLAYKKFASTNMVYGIGSYTYQHNTRDTFGFALKSTLCKVNGDERQIFKDPVTDNGVKKSQKGAVSVYRDKNGKLKYEDGLFLGVRVEGDILDTVFRNGVATKQFTLGDIRQRLSNERVNG